MMPRSTFARNLKFLRKISKINQQNLAERLGITRNRIASYETQNIEPKLDLLAQIASFFKISIDDLISTEITESNYWKLREVWVKSQEDIIRDKGEFSPAQKIFVVTDRSINQFISKNLQIGKAVEGLRAYYQMKEKETEAPDDKQQILYVLEHLLKVNQSFIARLHSLKENQK